MESHFRFEREIVSWEEAMSIPNGNTCSSECPSGLSSSHYAIEICSVLLNLIGLVIILRVPMLRGVIVHCITTAFGNVTSFLLRQRVDQRIALQRVDVHALQQESVVIEMGEDLQPIDRSLPSGNASW